MVLLVPGMSSSYDEYDEEDEEDEHDALVLF